MDIYQDCLCDNELHGLIIEGTATQDELEDLWDKLWIESCQISQGDTYNELFELAKEINDLQLKITIVKLSVEHLQMQFCQSVVDILNKLNMKCDLKAQHTGISLVSKLNAIIGRAKKWVITLQQRRKDIARIRKDQVADGAMDRGFFEDWMDALGKYYGYHVKASELTVARFWRGVTKLQEHNQRQEIKNRR